MPWRVIAHNGQLWHVDAIAERRPNTESWQLTLGFRARSAERPARGVGGSVGSDGAGKAGRSGGQERTIWTLYPLEAMSKSSLFLQAERIPDDALSQVLAEHLR
jgi:hypothetical protein